jgi:hypothetical protein
MFQVEEQAMRTWPGFMLLLVFCVSPVKADMITGIDDTAQLPFWEWRNDYMTLRFVQRLPDQTRAYFAGRGFKPQEVKYIASYCIFQTIYTNTSPPDKNHVIQHDVRDWRYHYQGKTYHMRPREDWKQIWLKKNVGQAQIIAFEWSLLPSKQIFQAGDYNWGMSVFKLPYGANFDLDISWKVDGKIQTATLKNLQCSKDIYVPPK